MSKRIYGWGIVDKDSAPWWDESCVCEDRGPMDDQVQALNEGGYREDHRCPYRVVRLYFETSAGDLNEQKGR